MTIVARLTALGLLLLGALAPLGSIGVLAQAKPPLVVIVGTSTPITDISLAALRRAFQGEPVEYAWGKRLIPFNLPGESEERTRFDRSILGLEPNEVGRFWINRRIRDEGDAPRTLPSMALGVKVVASLRGAIAYVTPALVNGRVRVLTIEGKTPSKPGYALASP